MIQVFQNHILLHAYIGDLIAKILFVREQLADLETNLRVFIRIEGRDTGLGGTEGLASQTFLLALDVYKRQPVPWPPSRSFCFWTNRRLV